MKKVFILYLTLGLSCASFASSSAKLSEVDAAVLEARIAASQAYEKLKSELSELKAIRESSESKACGLSQTRSSCTDVAEHVQKIHDQAIRSSDALARTLFAGPRLLSPLAHEYLNSETANRMQAVTLESDEQAKWKSANWGPHLTDETISPFTMIDLSATELLVQRSVTSIDEVQTALLKIADEQLR